jgi:competence transcription factor ComK
MLILIETRFNGDIYINPDQIVTVKDLGNNTSSICFSNGNVIVINVSGEKFNHYIFKNKILEETVCEIKNEIKFLNEKIGNIEMSIDRINYKIH